MKNKRHKAANGRDRDCCCGRPLLPCGRFLAGFQPAAARDDGRRVSGSVLILALWTALFLAVLVVAVAAFVSADINLAQSLADRSRAFYLAKAGVESAIAGISGDTNSWDALSEDWLNDRAVFADSNMGEGGFEVVRLDPGPDGGVTTNVGVADEERKLNINAVTNKAGCELMRSMLETAGGIDRAAAEAVVACMVDWVDADNEPSKDGVEGSYYESRYPSCSCHNGLFDCIQELLLIKGMNEELFLKLENSLTAYDSESVININTADPMVLAAAAGSRKGVDPADAMALVQRILKFRAQGKAFTSPDKQDIKRLLYGQGDLSENEAREWYALEWPLNHGILAVQSSHFRGIATGYVRGGENISTLRRIVFVYDRKRHRISSWNESY